MTTDAIPRRRLSISNSGLGVGLALLGFSIYTVATTFGRGHGTTTVRALVALPLGLVVVYLSFAWVCSACGAVLRSSAIDTDPARASDVAQAIADGQPADARRAWEAARGQPGSARISIEACPKCRQLARLRFRGAAPTIDGSRCVTGEAAAPFAEGSAPS